MRKGERHHYYHIQQRPQEHRSGKMNGKVITEGQGHQWLGLGEEHATHHSLFPKLQPFSRNSTLKRWMIPQRSTSEFLANRFLNFILFIHLLQKTFLGKFLLLKRPYKSLTNQSQSLKITNPHFEYSKDNSCCSIETEVTKVYFNAVVIWHSYRETMKTAIKTKAR